MTSNVVQIVMGALNPQVVTVAAERLGETPDAVATALNAAVPGAFRLLGVRGGEEGGPEALLAAIRAGGVAFSLADPLGRLPAAGADAETVLGEDGRALGERVADFAGLGGASGGALVAMVTPLALGALARTAPPPLNADTLRRTLTEQANAVDRALPPGFTLGGPQALAASTSAAPPSDTDQVRVVDRATAFAGPSVIPPVQPPATAPAASAPAGSAGLPKWLLPLLAVLILLAVVFVLIRNLGGDERAPAPAPDPGPATAAAPASVSAGEAP